MYRQRYPEYFDHVPLPSRYKKPDFSMFSKKDNVLIVDHISRLLAQCGEAMVLSLSGSAFTWFVSLPPNSINCWVDLE